MSEDNPCGVLQQSITDYIAAYQQKINNLNAESQQLVTLVTKYDQLISTKRAIEQNIKAIQDMINSVNK